MSCKTLGEFLRSTREVLGQSQEGFAKWMKMEVRTLQGWEQRSSAPRGALFADALNKLLNGEGITSDQKDWILLHWNNWQSAAYNNLGTDAQTPIPSESEGLNKDFVSITHAIESDSMTVVHFQSLVRFLKLIRWRDRTKGIGPFQREKVTFGDAEFDLEIFDEAVSFAFEPIISKNGSEFSRAIYSSGISNLVAVPPTECNIDFDTYRQTDGKLLRCVFSLQDTDCLVYTRRLYNGFQKGREDFSIGTNGAQADRLHLTVDFSSVLKTYRFSEIPSGRYSLLSQGATPVGVPVASSEDGTIWSVQVENPDRKSRLSMRWALS